MSFKFVAECSIQLSYCCIYKLLYTNNIQYARNFLNSNQIFQFLELTYTECKEEEIATMVKGSFLESQSCIQAILKAGKENNQKGRE